jgi:hypothetical protein
MGSTIFDSMICQKKHMENEPEIIFIWARTYLGVRIYPFLRYKLRDENQGNTVVSVAR